jgi:thymidylate kinase
MEGLLKDEQRFQKILSLAIGEYYAELVTELVKKQHWLVFLFPWRFRKQLIVQSLRRRPLHQLYWWLTYLWQGLRINLSGGYKVFLAFIGPDGSGKSTAANALLSSELVKKLFERQYLFYRDFPILPKLGDLARSTGHTLSLRDRLDAVRFRNTTPLPWLRSIIYPLYYGFNNTLAHIWLWWQERRGGALIIFDRYFYEFMVQLTYSKCPRWLLRLMMWLIPKPDIIVCFSTAPEVIFSRKQELSIDEINRQLRMYEEIARNNKNSLIVNSAISVEEVIDQIQEALLKFMERRGH